MKMIVAHKLEACMHQTIFLSNICILKILEFSEEECSTADCKVLSSRMLGMMNHTASPCDVRTIQIIL